MNIIGRLGVLGVGVVGVVVSVVSARGVVAAPPAPGEEAKGSFRIVGTFPVGGEGGWDYVAIDPAARRLYVPRSTRVLVLNAETGETVGEIADTAGVHGVALAPSLGKGFTSNGRAGNVTVFDLGTLKTLGTVAAGQNPDAIMYEPTTKRVFVFNGRSHDATVINAEDLSVVGTVSLGGKPEFGVADGKGRVFVNLEDAGEIAEIDAHSLKVLRRMPVAPGTEPSGLAIDAPNHHLFAVCGNEKMVVLDTETGKVIATPPIGKGVDGVAFDPTGGCAIASNGEGTITVVSTGGEKPFTVLQTLPTIRSARTIAVDPTRRLLYLPCAEFEPAPAPAEGERRRPPMKEGSFRILVVGI